MNLTINDVKAFATTIVCALLGVMLFLLMELPLPWLLGAIWPLLIVSHMDQVQLRLPTRLLGPSRALLGIGIGGSFTPAILASLDSYLMSLIFMPIFLVAVIYFGRLYYQYVVGLDKSTSTFCSLPGGILEMAITSEAVGADVKRVMLTHTTRVLLIIYGIPLFIQFIFDIDLSGNFVMPGASSEFSIIDVVVVFGAAVAGWWLMSLLRFSGAAIIGPMLACGAVYMTGWVSFKLPGAFINFAQIVLGIKIGLSMRGVTIRDIIENAFHALGLFIIVLAIVFAVAYSIQMITDLPLIAIFLAFVPGGQAEMNIIAIMVGVHVPYIALHHVTRMFLVMTMIPVIARLTR